jgi:5'(3')-deoxyribonucleotidase
MVTNLGPGSKDAIRSYMRYPDIYQELDPIPGACEGMYELVARGHDVIVATAVPKSAAFGLHGKQVWLRKNMPFFSLDNLVSIHRKDLLRADLILDDGVHNLVPCQEADMLAVCLDNPWNQDWHGLRVQDWAQFLRLVTDVENALGGKGICRGTPGEHLQMIAEERANIIELTAEDMQSSQAEVIRAAQDVWQPILP